MELQPGLAKLEFAMGSHGLEWKNCEVVRVSCQARLLGVKPGWSINMIAGVPVTDSYQIWNELHKNKKSGRKYQIYFVKDEATIRADQAKAEAERQKKEKDMEERRRREENERKIREEAEKKIREEEVALERERHHQEFMRKHEENQKRVQETLELENKRQEYMRKELDDQKRVEEEKKRQEYIRKHKEDQKRLDETKYQQDPLDEVMASKKDVIDLEIEYDTSLREGVTLSAAIALKEKVSRTKDNLSKIDPRKGPNTNSKHRADLMKEATKYRIDLLLGKTDKLVAQVREVMQRRQQQEENPATWLATIGDWELTLDAEGAFFWHKSTGAWQVDPPPQVLRYFDPTNIDRIPDHMFNMILENYAVMPQALANAALHKMARMKAMRKQEEERRKREDYARSKAAQLQIGTVPLMQQWGNHDIFQQGNIFFQDLCSQYLTQALPSQPSYVPPERSIVDIYFPPQDQSRVPRVCRGELQIVQPQHFLTTSPAIYMTRTGL